MALVWEFDLVGSVFAEGENARRTYTRQALARNIAAGTVPQQLREIYDDPGLPARGDPLDATDWPNLLVTGRNVNSILCLDQGISARVTLTYQNFTSGFLPLPNDNGPVIVTTNDSSLNAVTTTEDNTGTRMFVEHEGKTQPASTDLLVPVSTISCARLENNNPRDRSDVHVGTVNNGLWNGYPPRTVLCEGIAATTSDGGDSFEVEYRFAYRPDTWDVVVFYVNEEQKPVLPETVDNKKTYQIYPESNFGLLNISI